MNFTKNIGMLLLAIYLILVGLTNCIVGFVIPRFCWGSSRSWPASLS